MTLINMHALAVENTRFRTALNHNTLSGYITAETCCDFCLSRMMALCKFSIAAKHPNDCNSLFGGRLPYAIRSGVIHTLLFPCLQFNPVPSAVIVLFLCDELMRIPLVYLRFSTLFL